MKPLSNNFNMHSGKFPTLHFHYLQGALYCEGVLGLAFAVVSDFIGVMISMFLDLSEHLLNLLLTEWIDVVDIGRLDGAMCEDELREKFL